MVPASYNACTLEDGIDASVVDRGPREIFASSCMVGGVRTIRVYQAYNVIIMRGLLPLPFRQTLLWPRATRVYGAKVE